VITPCENKAAPSPPLHPPANGRPHLLAALQNQLLEPPLFFPRRRRQLPHLGPRNRLSTLIYITPRPQRGNTLRGTEPLHIAPRLFSSPIVMHNPFRKTGIRGPQPSFAVFHEVDSFVSRLQPFSLLIPPSDAAGAQFYSKTVTPRSPNILFTGPENAGFSEPDLANPLTSHRS